MTKKDLCLALWGQIVQDTRLFAHHVLDKITLHKPSSSSASTHDDSMDHSQQQQHDSSSQQQSQPHQQKQKKKRSRQHRPLQIYTPYRHVYYSSTLSLNVRSTSCTSLSSTINSSGCNTSGSGNELISQYESLWEVQLALREIPGMIEGNILESCEDASSSSATATSCTDTAAGGGAAVSSASLSSLPPPLPHSQSHTSFSSTTQPQQRTFDALEEFPRYPSDFYESDSESEDDDESDEDDEDDEEEGEEVYEEADEVESFVLQPFTQRQQQQQLQPHPLLRVYSPFHSTSTSSSLCLSLAPEHNNNIKNNNDYSGFILSIEPPQPQLQQRRQEQQQEEGTEFALSKRHLRSSLNSNAAPTLGTTASLSNDLLRSDRKDSGVFVHDDEDGIIVQVSPRSISFPSSSGSESECESESESESEVDHVDDKNNDGPIDQQYGYRFCEDKQERTELRSRWMNGVTCINTTDNSNSGDSDNRGHGRTTLRRRETNASTFPSLMAAVSFISLQA